jgi:transcription termination factor Rho
MKSLTIKDLEQKTLAELRVQAKSLKMEDFMELPKRELMIEILKNSTENDGYIFVEGILEVVKEGTHGY